MDFFSDASYWLQWHLAWVVYILRSFRINLAPVPVLQKTEEIVIIQLACLTSFI